MLAFATLAAGAAGVYPNAHLLVETGWLSARLEDPAIRIVDLRSAERYAEGHVPGAVHLEIRRLLATVDGVPAMAAPPERLAAVLGGLGIDNRTTVVAYDDRAGLLAARLFWTLEYAGHREARILDGGFPAWARSGRPVSREPPSYPARTFEVRIDRSVVVTADDIASRLGDPDVAVLDVRSREEFTGADRRAERGGHIPGAIHLEWQNAVAGETPSWRPADDLAALYRAAGITPDKEVIPYCQSHVRGAHAYFTLRLLGFEKVRGYDGSWLEWGNRTDLPLER